ncbi:MAG TPA: bifunctional DNA-formamidopyrimidine glycosylase/DNA-(apurinic or apyrimidinic site) lyase [Phycisphaerales bacterium]|nr:bifunctional DNA-formamidopyrimidine glycosylase/DNA-(apurinic or apyrimidinic site) lyase [Phycisphaerales bacterium]
MPELPEVEAQRRSLLSHVVGAVVSRVEILRADICDAADAAGKLHTPRAADLCEAGTIDRIDRLGKQMAIVARDGRVMNVHLGMTGMLIALAPQQEPAQTDHIHVRWHLSRHGKPAGTLLFRDPRRFGGVWTFPSTAALMAHRWNVLGPDALSATGSQLHERLQSSERAVKAALLDQRIIAGVGNIYADKSLFRAGVSPVTQCRALGAARWNALAQAIREVMMTAVEAGGSTLRDGTYTDSTGKAGGFQHEHKVYGRGELPCFTCATKLQRKAVAQRTTVWCPCCQPD